MSLEEFIQRTLRENKEEVDKIRKLEDILEKIGVQNRRPRIYSISVTTNS